MMVRMCIIFSCIISSTKIGNLLTEIKALFWQEKIFLCYKIYIYVFLFMLAVPKVVQIIFFLPTDLWLILTDDSDRKLGCL